MMVQPYDDDHLLVVLQTDHSRVAGLLAAHWGNDAFAAPRPYASVVLAAQEHDQGWGDWEACPTLDPRGYPIDYFGSTRPLGQIWLDFYTRGIERVARLDPYAGLLVLLHGVGLVNRGHGLLPYMPDYSDLPAVQAFIESHEHERQALAETMRQSSRYGDQADDTRVWANYKLLQVFDQYAQFLCNRYPLTSTARRGGPEARLANVPVRYDGAADDVTLELTVVDGTRATVHPYPFDVSPLAISYPARLLPRQPYPSQDAFLHDYYTAPSLTITYTLQAA